jgi:hypothetical protein
MECRLRPHLHAQRVGAWRALNLPRDVRRSRLRKSAVRLRRDAPLGSLRSRRAPKSYVCLPDDTEAAPGASSSGNEGSSPTPTLSDAIACEFLDARSEGTRRGALQAEQRASRVLGAGPQPRRRVPFCGRCSPLPSRGEGAPGSVARARRLATSRHVRRRGWPSRDAQPSFLAAARRRRRS